MCLFISASIANSKTGIHLLAASMASGSLWSMTALRAAAGGGREAIIDKSDAASPKIAAVDEWRNLTCLAAARSQPGMTGSS
jgi:hypothetical protein